MRRLPRGGADGCDASGQRAVLSNLHGSLRYYANSADVAIQWLAPDVYVAALEQLRESGRRNSAGRIGTRVFRARYASVADLSCGSTADLIAAKRVFFYQLWPAADDRASVLPQY